ncbi:VWA domain-containing protein [uncultured Ilyobacter sp.]|uniref:VWA domain-containing protein n=1 Tax=uncultured Ilyobacter sp. TaxID=544433 RepID=UPI0029C6ACF0|nr:VWA domain-containing protein [uncultured Ilyobacter sp.]
MEFGNLKYSLFFILIPIVFIILYLGFRKKASIKKQLALENKVKFELVRNTSYILSLILIVFSLTQPRILRGFEKIKIKGLDIYLLIDVSKSMLAEDVLPNRLDRSKHDIDKLLDGLKGDRVGFIPFSSSAYIQMPLTDDYDMAKMFANVIDTDLISGGGTNITQALKLARQSFKNSDSNKKIILVVSDGDEHENNSLKYLKEQKLKNEDFKVYSLGVGTSQGGGVPNTVNGQHKGFLKDENGRTVIAKLETDILKKLAEEGDGKFYISDNFHDGIEAFLNDISLLKRGENREEKIKNYKELYQYFLFSGILLFLLAYFLDHHKNRD